MSLDAGTLEHLRNSHAAHTARETAWEKSPDEIKVVPRTEMYAFLYESVGYEHVSVSVVSTCAWGKAIRFLKSETQVFPKGLKQICHLLTIILSALPLSAFLPLSKCRELIFFSFFILNRLSCSMWCIFVPHTEKKRRWHANDYLPGQTMPCTSPLCVLLLLW